MTALNMIRGIGLPAPATVVQTVGLRWHVILHAVKSGKILTRPWRTSLNTNLSSQKTKQRRKSLYLQRNASSNAPTISNIGSLAKTCGKIHRTACNCTPLSQRQTNQSTRHLKPRSKKLSVEARQPLSILMKLLRIFLSQKIIRKKRRSAQAFLNNGSPAGMSGKMPPIASNW